MVYKLYLEVNSRVFNILLGKLILHIYSVIDIVLGHWDTNKEYEISPIL